MTFWRSYTVQVSNRRNFAANQTTRRASQRKRRRKMYRSQFMDDTQFYIFLYMIQIIKTEMQAITNDEEKKKEHYFHIARQNNRNTPHIITESRADTKTKVYIRHAQKEQVRHDFTTLKRSMKLVVTSTRLSFFLLNRIKFIRTNKQNTINVSFFSFIRLVVFRHLKPRN